jgi:ribosomal protein S18 acetylase RimI-like enzyme
MSYFFPEKGTIYVIENQNTIIGYLTLINYWSNEYGGNLIFIDEIYINPRYRNKGIGSDIIKTLTKQYINSCKAIQLEVLSSNLNAQKFYEKNGFKYFKK